jgi:hypothetical protein
VPAALVGLLGLALAGVAGLARPRLAVAVLLAAVVLVPDTLAIPTGVTSTLTIHLVVTVGALAGLLWRTIAGRTSSAVWRPTAASLALAGYLLVAILIGIAFASGDVVASDALRRALDLVQDVGVLVAVTALVREDGRPAEFVAPIVGVLLASAGIGLIEHVTGDSWGHYLFSRVPSQAGTPAATPLQTRGGGVRVRAGADFSLSYAWVLIALLPLVLVEAARRMSRSIGWTVPAAVAVAAVLLAVYWSGTRSALVGLVVAALVAGALSGRPRLAAVTLVVLAAGVVAVVTLPAIGQHFSFGIDQGSVDVRDQRIPVILHAVSGRPFTGLGLAGLSSLGLSAVDSAFLLVYGETGALGLAALLAVLVVTVAAVARGLRTSDPQSRLVVACCIAGMLAIVASGLALDSIDLPSVVDVLWVLAGIGLVAAEQAVAPARLLRPVRVVAAAAAAAAVAGGAAALVAPTHHSASYMFLTLSPALDEVPGNPVDAGNTLIDTACGAMEARAAQLSDGLDVSCRDPFLSQGQGALQLTASSPARITAAVPLLTAAVKRAGVPAFELLDVSPSQAGRATGLVTLPASLAVFVALVTATVPLARRERTATGFRVLPPAARVDRRPQPA